jgi:hypothetical protein
MNQIPSEWNAETVQGIHLKRNKNKTFLFADDQVITAESET